MAKKDAYIRNPKDPGGSKWISAEDEEDFEQEKLIQEWLKAEGNSDEFGFKHINRKGTARNTIDRKSVRLDQKVSDESGSRTYADIIAGSDGRDLVGGDAADENTPKSSAELLTENLNEFFDAIGVSGRTKKWATETILKNAKTLSSSNREELRAEKLRSNSSISNLVSPRRYRTYKPL